MKTLSRLESDQTVYNAVGFDWWHSGPSLDRVFGPGVVGFFAVDRNEGKPVGVLLRAANERFADLALYVEPFTHNAAFITA